MEPTTTHQFCQKYLEQIRTLEACSAEVEGLIANTDHENDIDDQQGSQILFFNKQQLLLFVEEQQKKLQTIAAKVPPLIQKAEQFQILEREMEREIADWEWAELSPKHFEIMRKHTTELTQDFQKIYDANMSILASLKRDHADLQARRLVFEGRITHLSAHPLKRLEQRIEDLKNEKDPKSFYHYWLNRGKRNVLAAMSLFSSSTGGQKNEKK